MHGSHGRVLSVDLSARDHAVDELSESVYRRLLGGAGLASYLLYRACPPGTDPFDAANPLVFATSPFVGTPITTSAKLAVAAKSPLTGLIGDSLSSSYLAISLKRTGFDALVVRGRASEPTLLVVDGERVTLRGAAHLRGLDPEATAATVRAELGAEFRVAAIGLAGESGVRFAAISNDGRLAGRTGGGAVMGAKNLKAIAVRGDVRTSVADTPGLARAARALVERSLGTATAKYREVGTAANVAFFDRLGMLPTRNFSEGRFAGADAVSGERLLTEHGADRHACAACTVGCEHRYRTTDDGGGTVVRLEYETLFALGPLCGIDDPNVLLRAAALCDRLGMDAISAGVTIAWAMECRARGVALPGGVGPRFGSSADLLDAIESIGARRGIGDLLAEGSRAASFVVGQGSAEWAMHVKGLEMPGYDPRRLPTLALGLAVGARGACHNRSTAYEVDLSDRLSSGAEPVARAAAAASTEDQAAILDSLTLCKFLRGCFSDLPAEAAALYEQVTGFPTDGPELMACGERIVNLKKLFNQREGWTRADDGLPARLRRPDDGLEELIAAYYRQRGWRDDGTIPPETIERVGLSDLV